jgi:hypothetical protein
MGPLILGPPGSGTLMLSVCKQMSFLWEAGARVRGGQGE